MSSFPIQNFESKAKFEPLFEKSVNFKRFVNVVNELTIKLTLNWAMFLLIVRTGFVSGIKCFGCRIQVYNQESGALKWSICVIIYTWLSLV